MYSLNICLFLTQYVFLGTTTKREKEDINYRNIINVGRKNANQQKANAFKIQKTRTEAQDAFVKLVDNKEIYKNPTPQSIAERLGGEASELGKKILGIVNDEANKGIDLNGLITKLGKDSADAKKVNHMANLTNVFATENIEHIVKKLGGAESNAGKEFKRIIKEVDQNAATESRNILEVWHKAIKAKRYTAPLIIAGAAAGFAVAFIHNVLSTKTEA